MYVKVLVARKEKKVSQKTVADVLKINDRTYSLKETGKTDFTMTEGLVLAKYFNTTLNDLFMD